MAYTTSGASAYSTTGIGPLYTYVQKKLLASAKPYMPLHTLAQKRLIPLHSGKTARFTRLMQIPIVTSAAQEATAATPVQVYATHLDTTVDIWEKAIGVSTLLDDTFITPALTAYTENLGINCGQSMQLQLQETLWAPTGASDDVSGCIGLVNDRSAIGTMNYLCTATTTGTTTTFVDSAMYTNMAQTEGGDHIGGMITFNNPKSQLYGTARRISDSASTTGTVTWATATNVVPNAKGAACGYETARVCGLGVGGAAVMTAGTDFLRAKTLRRAHAILRKECALPITGTYYAACVGPDNEAHLKGDEASAGEFIDTFRYTDNEPILTNEIGRIAGVRIMSETNPYLIDATYGSTMGDYTGTATDLQVVFVLGRDCLGVCGLQGQNDLGESDTKVIIHRPGPQSISDPTEKLCTMAWKTTFARLPLNACFGVGIVTAPTAL